MGLKSSKSGVLPGYLCCPSKLEEFCDILAETDKEDSKKRKKLVTLLQNPIRSQMEPYIGKLFLLSERWDEEEGVRLFIKNVAKHNHCKPVLTKLFKSMLLMYGRDCITLHTEPCSKELNNLLTECFIELFKAGFSCKQLLSEGGGFCWFVNNDGEVRASYCPPYTRVACWAKFIQLFIQATRDMQVIHQIWCEVAPHLSHCSHVPSVHFRTQCQYALFCQRYNYKIWQSQFAELSGTENPAYKHMTVPISLVNCCVGVIRRNLKGPNVFYVLDRMPILPVAVKEQLLLRHIFITD